MIVHRHTLVNALRVAAEEYAKAAKVDPSLAETFEHQAIEVIDLAIEIEQMADDARLVIRD